MSTSNLLTFCPSDLPEAELSELLAELSATNGAPLNVSDALRPVLQEFIRKLSDGQSVVIAAQDEYITPAKAAKLLGVSRSYVSRQIRGGRLPAEKVGTHHRIAMREVVLAMRRRQALDDVFEAGEELEKYLS